jgi:hypothetical protein
VIGRATYVIGLRHESPPDGRGGQDGR